MSIKNYFMLFSFIFMTLIANDFCNPLIQFKREHFDGYFLKNLEEIDNYDTYIIIYFREDCYYIEGFKNEYRNNINFLINKENNEQIKDDEALIIHKNFGIEIHFNTNVKNLKGFFDYSTDINMEYLVSIDFSNFDASLITDISYLFYQCISLETIDLSNFDTSSVIDMSCMFSGCNSLKSIDLSNFDTSSVIYMNGIFSYCISLETIDLSNFDTSSVIDMGYMFSNCSSLKSIDILHFNTKAVLYMGSIFFGCSLLTSINLTNFDTSSVSNMEFMFYGCFP